MSIDIKTTSVEPLRKTFDHIAAKIGPDKAATRYQEAVWGTATDRQSALPPDLGSRQDSSTITSRTAIVMEDFDDLIDPRQYYYGTWTIQRGKQQDSQEKNFNFVESRGLIERHGRQPGKTRSRRLSHAHCAMSPGVRIRITATSPLMGSVLR